MGESIGVCAEGKQWQWASLCCPMAGVAVDDSAHRRKAAVAMAITLQ